MGVFHELLKVLGFGSNRSDPSELKAQPFVARGSYGRGLPPPLPCLGPPALSQMKVYWVCGHSVVFLLYLVGAEEEGVVERKTSEFGAR